MLCERAEAYAVTLFSRQRNHCKADAAASSSLRLGRNTSCKTIAATESVLFSVTVIVYCRIQHTVVTSTIRRPSAADAP